MAPGAATGRIVWGEIADPNGIKKLRPALIVTPNDQIVSGGSLTVVAITSRLTDPLPADYVLLPWHPQRHARTGLNRRCAAVCSWLVTISPNDIHDFAGVVPSAVMTTILEKVAAALASSPTPPASPNGDDSAAPPRPVQES
jgi:mRNA-degrading endonuclease toxin of MazEF toxin-antitoxin module